MGGLVGDHRAATDSQAKPQVSTKVQLIGRPVSADHSTMLF